MSQSRSSAEYVTHRHPLTNQFPLPGLEHVNASGQLIMEVQVGDPFLDQLQHCRACCPPTSTTDSAKSRALIRIECKANFHFLIGRVTTCYRFINDQNKTLSTQCSDTCLQLLSHKFDVYVGKNDTSAPVVMVSSGA